MRLALAALLLIGGATEARDTSHRRAGPFRFRSWEAWNLFGEGSTVTFEQENPVSKYRTRSTLTRKTGENFTIENFVEEAGTWVRSSVTMAGRARVAPPTECGLCKQPMKEHRPTETKESREKCTVAGRTFNCIVLETRSFRCDGSEFGHDKSWYSREVPG